jgi:hypothetical protein
MKLDDPYINYIIISAYQSKEDDLKNRMGYSKLQDSLIFKDFTILPMGGNRPSILAYKENYDNDELRYDAIELMDEYKQEYVIVKYSGEEIAKKILYDGREDLLGVVEYKGDENNHNFFVEGKAFSFEPRKRYIKPGSLKDFEKGMIVEFKNNNGEWQEKEVRDPEVEYERMYKLLIKYDKIRIQYSDSHFKK